MRTLSFLLILLLPAPLFSAQPGEKRPEVEAARMTSLATLYVKRRLGEEPETAYFSGLELERHDGLFDNSPRARAERWQYESWMTRELKRIDTELLRGRVEWITHVYMREDLRAREDLQVCDFPLWNVNQMDGWHTRYARIAELQPVGTSALREQALIRWKKLPAFIDQEIESLQLGLRRGYSAPRPVVVRVIAQLDGLLAVPLEESQLTSPARRDDDEAFSAAFTALVEQQVLPAYRRYREYLEKEYLGAAREALSVTANPKGRRCYEAALRAYTTLERSPEEVFLLGDETVAANRGRVVKLGMAAYGLSDFEAIIQHIKSDAADKFRSGEELLKFSQETVRRAQAAMPQWFGRVPALEAVVEPFPAYQEGTGVSARYEPGDGTRPGTYRIPLHQPETQSRGAVETTAFHEVWPGHHMQVAIAQSIEGLHDITRLVWFSGMGEGWARYSEALAAEMGLYQTAGGPISRLAWPARGMVVDPGIHILGWTREQAMAFMRESGRMTETQLNDMVDRIAILPGQLTAYDSGGLEIMALRALAEAELGEGFDIRAFHDAVLENGTLPLTVLREHVESWVAEEKARIAAAAEAAED